MATHIILYLSSKGVRFFDISLWNQYQAIFIQLNKKIKTQPASHTQWSLKIYSIWSVQIK